MVRSIINVRERFWSKVNFNGPIPRSDIGQCWVWEAYCDRDGYGLFVIQHGVTKRAHRVAYEWQMGSLEPGKPLDHLCRTRSCVRPDHLELVTPKINAERGLKGQQTHCKNGHEFTPENTYNYKNRRLCRKCRAVVEARRRQRIRDHLNDH